MRLARVSQDESTLDGAKDVSPFRTLTKEPIWFLGSPLNGGAASEKKHSFTTHLFTSKQFEIAVMRPVELALEVILEKPEGLSTRCQSSARVRGPVEALPEHPEQACCRVGIAESCALLGNVGEEGEADGVSKIGSEEQAKRVQEEFAPIGRFVEKASQF